MSQVSPLQKEKQWGMQVQSFLVLQELPKERKMHWKQLA
jgi:hypothetical protein